MIITIDLDQASEVLAQYKRLWESRGLSVGPITWRDRARDWPDQIVDLRSEAIEPDSVGLKVASEDEQGQFVLYGGGWADVAFVGGGPDPDWFYTSIGVQTPLLLADVQQLLDDFGARFHGRCDRIDQQ